MSKFINTDYKQTVNSLVDGFKNRLNNPYYLHMDRQPFVIDYYNQNTTKSTLDESAKIVYSNLNDQSPTKYNLIKDAVMYGLDRLSIDLDAGDFGLESSSGISGEAIILPNTWKPIPDDYFTIKHTNKKYLFKVTEVDINTLESGANFYKIAFSFDRPDDKEILDQVEDTYKMIVNNVGTEFKAVVRSNDYDFAELIDRVLSMLRKFYKAVFYRDRVQTFVFCYGGNYFYDPYMVEFMIRNSIMNGSEEYVFVDHALTIPSTFAIEYNKSFLRGLEECNINKFKSTTAYGITIEDPMSLLSTRKETYFKLDYSLHDFLFPVEILSADLVSRVVNNNKYGDFDNVLAINNMIINYFNNVEIEAKYVEMLSNIDYYDSKELFYIIPMIIFILEKRVKNLLR